MALKYMDYKRNRHIICKHTKQRYVITERNHRERTMFLTPAFEVERKGLLSNIRTGKIFAWNSLGGINGNWRTLRELNRHYILLEGAAKVLYG